MTPASPHPSPHSDPTPTVAVIGAATVVGRAVLARLAAGSSRVVAIDGTAPGMPPGNVEVKLMDARDRLLPLALDGIDAVVHAADHGDLSASPDTLYGRNVGATRNVLAAADKAGAGHVVIISSGTVYGAHDDNPVPLTEDAPLRANPGFAYGYQRQLVEEIAAEWAAEHPTTRVTVLRHAPILAIGLDNPIARLLTGPRLLIPAGGRPLWQFSHVDDLADAVAFCLDGSVEGTFNVASDGWLSTEEVARGLGTKVQPLGQATFRELLRRTSTIGLSPAPPEALEYLVHPWALSVDRLRLRGWRPRHTNAEILVSFAGSQHDQMAIGTLTVRRSWLRRALLGTASLVVVAIWRLVRR